jgi:hypothetical protein
MHDGDEKRFMEKVRKKRNGCWERKASVRGKYEMFSVRGKGIDAHRWSYLHFNGEISEGMLVCHSCDNPLCVNPKHLFLGTHKDNMIDASNKGRLCKSRLTKRQVSNIRKSDLSICELSKKYGVWDSTIRRIKNNKSWKMTSNNEIDEKGN